MTLEENHFRANFFIVLAIFGQFFAILEPKMTENTQFSVFFVAFGKYFFLSWVFNEFKVWDQILKALSKAHFLCEKSPKLVFWAPLVKIPTDYIMG